MRRASGSHPTLLPGCHSPPTQPTSSACEHSKPALIRNPGRWPAPRPRWDCHSPASSAGGNPTKRLRHSLHATQAAGGNPAAVSMQLPKVWPLLEIAVVGQRRFLMVAPHRPHQRPALRKPAQHGQGIGALQGGSGGGGGGWAEGLSAPSRAELAARRWAGEIHCTKCICNLPC